MTEEEWRRSSQPPAAIASLSLAEGEGAAAGQIVEPHIVDEGLAKRNSEGFADGRNAPERIPASLTGDRATGSVRQTHQEGAYRMEWMGSSWVVLTVLSHSCA